jgi:hypothetical protein
MNGCIGKMEVAKKKKKTKEKYDNHSDLTLIEGQQGKNGIMQVKMASMDAKMDSIVNYSREKSSK